MADECSYSIFSDGCGGLNAADYLLYSQILPQLSQIQQPSAIKRNEEVKTMNESESWYISQLIGERLEAEVNKALSKEKAAMQRKKEFDQHANETINDWVTEMKEHATAQEKPLPEMNCAQIFNPSAAPELNSALMAQYNDSLRCLAQKEKSATAQEKQPLGALGRACLMFKILTNIDMTEQQAEKFLDLVKVCEGHTND